MNLSVRLGKVALRVCSSLFSHEKVCFSKIMQHKFWFIQQGQYFLRFLPPKVRPQAMYSHNNLRRMICTAVRNLIIVINCINCLVKASSSITIFMINYSEKIAVAVVMVKKVKGSARVIFSQGKQYATREIKAYSWSYNESH